MTKRKQHVPEFKAKWTCPEKVESTNGGTRRCSIGNGNRPTPEFRREAVRLALTSGRTRREIAEDLGIGLSTLTRWLRDERDVREPSEAPVDVHAELKRKRFLGRTFPVFA